ncbi:hypothetical protein DBV15_08931 [Temnothorax longispinosus]|uniref:Uncharacterized protein n=1 Tax=Temnothorax longispinosus TaxID=300112 RepID=A0A4S2JBL2_9HYME|nr:hypothetical protein DBV15_08931 [Temnothorax longispinosus]
MAGVGELNDSDYSSGPRPRHVRPTLSKPASRYTSRLGHNVSSILDELRRRTRIFLGCTPSVPRRDTDSSSLQKPISSSWLSCCYDGPAFATLPTQSFCLSQAGPLKYWIVRRLGTSAVSTLLKLQGMKDSRAVRKLEEGKTRRIRPLSTTKSRDDYTELESDLNVHGVVLDKRHVLLEGCERTIVKSRENAKVYRVSVSWYRFKENLKPRVVFERRTSGKRVGNEEGGALEEGEEGNEGGLAEHSEIGIPTTTLIRVRRDTQQREHEDRVVAVVETLSWQLQLAASMQIAVQQARYRVTYLGALNEDRQVSASTLNRCTDYNDSRK